MITPLIMLMMVGYFKLLNIFIDFHPPLAPQIFSSDARCPKHYMVIAPSFVYCCLEQKRWGIHRGQFSLILHFSAHPPTPRSWLWPMGPGFSLQGLTSALGPWLPRPSPSSSPWALAPAPKPWGPGGGNQSSGADAKPWRLKPDPMDRSQGLGLETEKQRSEESEKQRKLLCVDP